MLPGKERLDRIPAPVSVASPQLGEFSVSETRLWVQNWAQALAKAEANLSAGAFSLRS